MNSKKLFAGVIALAMVVVAMPGTGNAQATAEDLAAQIAQLQAQLASLMGQLGTTTASGVERTDIAACTGITFTRNLTLGSQGTDVRCLQAMLNQDPATQVAATGVGSAGNETQYFGGLTRAAVVAFQNKYAVEVLAPVGLTSGTGFVGASTRAKLNAMLAGTTTGTTGGTGTTGTTLPAGCTSTAGYSPITGEPCSSTTTSTGTGLTMTGAEGTITVTTNPVPANNQTSYEGDEKVSVYAVKIKATGSDVDVQRATLRFDNVPYSYLSNIYLYDGDTQIASSPLNSTTVSRVSGSDYQITLAGFTTKMIVPVNTTKVLTVKVDVQPGISGSLLTSSGVTVKIGTPSTTAIRAIDQAGLNQYGGLAWTDYRTFILKPSQIADATLAVSRNTNTPLARNIVADTNSDIIGATLLTFNVKATKDDVRINDINNVTFSGSDPSAAYLVDDAGTIISTGSTIASNKTNFTDINYTIPKDTTKTFSIKVDVNTLAAATTMGVTVYGLNGSTVEISAERSNGTTMTSNVTGSATSHTAQLLVAGPVFTLSNVATTSTQSSTSASSTISATFTVNVEAKGGDVYMVADGQSGNGTVTDAFTVKTNNTTALAHGKVAYQKPSTADQYTDCGAGAVTCYKIAQDTSATFAVTATYVLDTTAGNFYLNVANIYWDTVKAQAGISTTEASTYMATDWLSNTVFLQ